MNKRMPESYFKEKQEQSSDCLQSAVHVIQGVELQVRSMDYTKPDSTDLMKIHEALEGAVNTLIYARRDFAKTSWASSNTTASFAEWLIEHNLSELVMGEGK